LNKKIVLKLVELSKRIRTFCLLMLEGNVVLITSLLPFLIHLCEVDSLFWTRYLEKSLFCLDGNWH
jgi:hypothetical protein